MSRITEFNNRFAVWTVSHISTMGCAYAFAVIACVALPQAVQDTFSDGFRPLPLVTWLSQSFLQLVLLAVIMKGQDLQGQTHEKRDIEQHDAVMEEVAELREILNDVREDHEKIASMHSVILQRTINGKV